MLICLDCDFGNIYCPDCKKTAKINRYKKANKKYRMTSHGKMQRARQEKMRRLRLKLTISKQTELKFVGDRTTIFPSISAINENVTVVVTCKNIAENISKGDLSEDPHKIHKEKNTFFRFQAERGGKRRIYCSFCSQECNFFSYDTTLPLRYHRQRWP
ncbi:hypothetical protein JCM31447_31570 (plasmid) [Fluviispira sanaruensis]|uniref:Uncharacterized protein n=1 Tax=Fluviispira sanaruensis TaxID=2493639 RepID=A0A4P2VMP7_FLUSA|nr:hypothetical protein JCM31447_31570 [Fluviispira sanaruensis]